MRASTIHVACKRHSKTNLYCGCIRDERGNIVWQCEHVHQFRDTDAEDRKRPGHLAGVSAITCARRALAQMQVAERETGALAPVAR